MADSSVATTSNDQTQNEVPPQPQTQTVPSSSIEESAEYEGPTAVVVEPPTQSAQNEASSQQPTRSSIEEPEETEKLEVPSSVVIVNQNEVEYHAAATTSTAQVQPAQYEVPPQQPVQEIRRSSIEEPEEPSDVLAADQNGAPNGIAPNNDENGNMAIFPNENAAPEAAEGHEVIVNESDMQKCIFFYTLSLVMLFITISISVGYGFAYKFPGLAINNPFFLWLFALYIAMLPPVFVLIRFYRFWQSNKRSYSKILSLIVFSGMPILCHIIIISAWFNTYGYIFEKSHETFMLKALNESDKSYITFWDNVQISFKCCGVRNYANEWYKSVRWPHDDFVPDSCCNQSWSPYVSRKGCGKSGKPQNFYQQGCYEKYIDFHAIVLSFVIVNIIFALFIEICIVRVLVTSFIGPREIIHVNEIEPEPQHPPLVRQCGSRNNDHRPLSPAEERALRQPLLVPAVSEEIIPANPPNTRKTTPDSGNSSGENSAPQTAVPTRAEVFDFGLKA